IKELETYKSKVADLEKSIATQLDAELSALPGKYGFDSVQDFLLAVKKAAGSKSATKKKGKRGRPAAAAPAGKRKRAKITPELKAEVKSAVEAGKTGAAIAKEFGISLPSVQNIKKEFGLVKARG
ncbi:MAG TPA: helix-turn-helix domain-containing protein, partial [Opitutaceae bacterium]